MQTLTKTRLRDALSCTDAEIAGLFGISPSAVSQWRDDRPIPELRVLQIQAKRPDLFAPGAPLDATACSGA